MRIADILAARLGALRGWHRLAMAVVAGGLLALALPPFDVLPVVLVSFPVLVLLLAGEGAGRRAWRRGFAVGWGFGFGYLLAGLWWIGAAFLVDAQEFAALMPFAVIALPASLAFFFALGCLPAALPGLSLPARLAMLAAGLALSEWLRGTVLTGFPWNTLAMTVQPLPWLMQSGAWIGPYGVAMVAVLVGGAPALLAARSGRARSAVAALAGLAALVHVGAGLRMPAPGSAPGSTDGAAPAERPVVRLVQPAIDQRLKWVPGQEEATMARHLDLTARPPGPLGAFDVAVWPESAFPFLVLERPDRLRQIAATLAPGQRLATGAMRRVPPRPGTEDDIANSVLFLDTQARPQAAYDKVRLVPFGEYLPLAHWLGAIGLRRLVPGGGFVPGAGREAVAVPGLGLAWPLICYEVIFPEPPAGPRPDFVLTVTNDGWFGRTPGPYQHARMARLRGVEWGLPVVRAANTGISFVTDAWGRSSARLDLGRSGVADARLPEPGPPTLHARTGHWPALSLCLVLLGLFARTRARARAATG